MSSSDRDRGRVTVVGTTSVSIGVFWYVWGAWGFWWGVLCGLGWPVWLGYRLAKHLVQHP